MPEAEPAMYQEAALVGALFFAATALLCTRGLPSAAAGLARLARATIVAPMLGSRLTVAIAIAGVMLHVSLAALAVTHMVLFYALITRSYGLLAQSINATRVSAWLLAASAAAELGLRAYSAGRRLPQRLCAIMLDGLLVAAPAVALARPWSWLHWPLGLTASAVGAYMLARGHTLRAVQLLRARMLRI